MQRTRAVRVKWPFESGPASAISFTHGLMGRVASDRALTLHVH